MKIVEEDDDDDDGEEEDNDDDDDHTWPAPYGDSGGRNVEQGRSSTCTRSENYTSLYILYMSIIVACLYS